MQNRRTVFVCEETPCLSTGSHAVYEALKAEVARQRVKGAKVEISGCHGHGLCDCGPSVVVEPDRVFYIHVQAEDAQEIISSHLRDNKPVERLFYRDPVTGQSIPHYADINFYKKQQRVILHNCGHINPEKIADYTKNEGFRALRKAVLHMTPEMVIDEVKRAGLRGRGGAGFPTWRKWEFCRSAHGDEKFIICNADEGDPGAFMDRSILEADPYAVIEGLTIAGYAIGATEGYIYVRAEYPLAVQRTRHALAQAMKKGYLGNAIFGSDFNFTIHIKEGAGAFVCGEETALIASIESRRGMPRPRPPFPAQAGLDGKPTIINNVKSLASIPLIIANGAEWYATIGTEKSRGTAVFALTGKVTNSGLVEVPMGTPLSTIIFDIGGGIPRDKRFKAVQTGGPSGGCIPSQFLDTPVDYENLARLGSIMGSGGMVVMDEATCMVEVARYFVSFTQMESCGKCVPCRLGTKQMLEILTRITQGKGHENDIDTLLSIAKTVKECSLCGLGQTCPNPVLSTLNYFRDEYDAHIKEKRCPAAVCDALMISPCQHTCPVGINVPKYVAHVAAGEYLQAVETIRERNPFPAICGRICHHPCEGRCRRGELDESVAIRSLKRFAADWYFDHINELPEPDKFARTRSQKVAVIGAGPCGLSCAYFLAQMGYGVTIFEATATGGGMPATAIPDFRLPREVIDSEIAYIVKRGVEIKYNVPLDTKFTIEHLRADGYDAVYIAAGAHKSQRIGIPGESEDLAGFHYGLRFLHDAKLGKKAKVGQRVAIIGGGNVALDASRTALRLGAQEVNIYYRRSREEMPATEVEFNEAIAEGINIHFLVSPTRISIEDGKVTGLQCTRMKLGELDTSGRRTPLPIPESEFFAAADTVIVAVGQAADLSFLPPDSALERSRWERLVVDSNTLSTNVPGIFAGGDFVFGPGMIIEAIASGRRGALAIDKYIRSDRSLVQMYDMRQPVDEEAKGALTESEETWEAAFRPEMPVLPIEDRKRSFEETELGFSEEKARYEANRCLRCDLET